MKRAYVSPDVVEFGLVSALTGVIQDSARIDENENTGMTGHGSYDVCYLQSCTPEKGDSPGGPPN